MNSLFSDRLNFVKQITSTESSLFTYIVIADNFLFVYCQCYWIIMDYVNNLQLSVSETATETVYGHCRCCLEEGDHRDITKVYIENGQREDYGDIFLSCFNLFLSTNTNLSTLICSSCVSQLRNAKAFKDMVINTEQQLMKALLDCDNDQIVLVNVPVSEDTLNTTIGFKIEVNQNVSATKDESEYTDLVTVHDLNNEKLQETEVQQENYSDEPDSGFIEETEALLKNICNLLGYSNATLFKTKNKFGFPCFYCRTVYEDFKTLRHHQEEHTRTNLYEALEKYTAETLVVYAEVTDLKCMICDMGVKDLKELQIHLSDLHGREFYSNYTDRVVPFKLLEDKYFQCQVCHFNFETFGAIEKHMNTHYRNYVCSDCGVGFVTSMRLKTHLNSIHRIGSFACEYCDRVFNTQLKFKSHMDFVHKMLKKLTCPKCPERFSDYFVRKKHMVEVHGETPVVYRCNVCFRGFNRRYTLSCHMKRHLDQKDFECELCSYKCYSKSELKQHMLKHTRLNGERVYSCLICKKTYSRKKTLREHLRIHNREVKFPCNICNRSFVHESSLFTHMSNRHNKDDK